MKSSKIVSLIFLTLSIVNCVYSNDDDSPSPPSATIFDVNDSKLLLDEFFKPELNVLDENESNEYKDNDETTMKSEKNKSLKDLQICVTLTPGYVSTRRKLVTFECQAKICTASNDEFMIDSGNDDYHFERPMFDWKTEFNHLLLMTNSSCNIDRTLCKINLEVNVENFADEMIQNNMNEMKISCNVADFIRIGSIENDEIERHSINNNSYHYISGQANSLIKFFKGNGIHQACNRSIDCGENMICSPDQTKDDKSSNNGYCECPNESIRIQVEKPTGTNVKLNSYILVIDHQYDELICAPKRSLNESCQYDQQCAASDSNSYCRPIYSEHGFATSASICECSFGYVEDNRIPNGKCISAYLYHNQQAESNVKKDIVANENKSVNYPPPSVVPKGVFVWWIIKPKSINHTDRITSTYRFLWQRYSHQRYLTQMLMIIVLLIPFFILLISSIYLHYYRQMLEKHHQYKSSATALHSLPPSPISNGYDNKSFNEINQYDKQQISLQQEFDQFNMSYIMNDYKDIGVKAYDGQDNSKKLDKIELIKNDTLMNFYQINRK